MFPFDQAFEITEEDIAAVLCAMDLPHEDEDVAGWLPKLDMTQAVKAALRADDIDDQALSAHENLREQIHALGESERLAKARAQKALTETVSGISIGGRRRASP